MFRSFLFNAAFWGWIFILGILGLPFALVSTAACLRIARWWALASLFFLRIFCGITYRVEGLEHLPTDGRFLIASKHQSAWDTIIFWAILPRVVFVLKKELLWLPVFGWHLYLLKCIAIDRSAGGKAMKMMLKSAKARVEEGRTPVIFPEGTRIAPDATSMFHPGVAAMYNHLNIPLVPVALNSGLFWGKNAFRKRAGVITIRILPAIPPGLKSRALLDRIERDINTQTAALVAQASAEQHLA